MDTPFNIFESSPAAYDCYRQGNPLRGIPWPKKFADDNFKFDENGRKLFKWVENTVGKGEIGRYEQFLLFPQCFQKACFPGASKGVVVWEWVNMKDLNLYMQYRSTSLAMLIDFEKKNEQSVREKYPI